MKLVNRKSLKRKEMINMKLRILKNKTFYKADAISNEINCGHDCNVLTYTRSELNKIEKQNKEKYEQEKLYLKELEIDLPF